MAALVQAPMLELIEASDLDPYRLRFEQRSLSRGQAQAHRRGSSVWLRI